VGRAARLVPSLLSAKIMSKKLIGIIASASLGAVLLFALVFSLLASGSYTADQQLDLALRLLDEGRWDLADRIARDVESRQELTPAREPVWNYVRGVAGAMGTQGKLESPQARRVLWQAAEFLVKSRDAGFPIGYRGKGAYYLGYCYYQTYNWEDTLAALESVPERWPERRGDAYDMMVEACLRNTPPDREKGEELLRKWSGTSGISGWERNQIALRSAHLAFLDGDWDACEARIAAIPANSEQAVWAQIARGHWRLERGRRTSDERQRGELLQAALDEFLRTARSPAVSGPARRQAAFLSGLTLRVLQRPEEAISTLSMVRQRNPLTAEAVAAGIEEAEMRAEAGSASDAVETARHVIDDLGDVRLYDERWLPLADLRTRLLGLGRLMQNQQAYPETIRLAAYLPPVFPGSDAVRLEAETYRLWGESLEREAGAGNAQQRSETRRQADTKFLLAGDRYRQLARLEVRSPTYPSILWDASEAYRKSHQLDQATELLVEYIAHEERAKRPRALLALGQNYLNAAKWNEALSPLQRCLSEFPEHPICYEVRLVMAKALAEMEQLESATEHLLSNLYDGNLQPDSPLWRESLFELGSIIYRRGDQLTLGADLAADEELQARLARIGDSHAELLRAIDRLSEAVERFGSEPRAFEARYAVGRAYTAAAWYPQQLLASGQVTIEASRRQLALQRRQLLGQALDAYRELKRAIGEVQERAKLSDTAQSLLRNCYFAEADTLFELEVFEDAIQAYRAVGNRFVNEPEALEALVQIAECYRKLGQADQARRTLIQAEQMLSRIPADQNSRFPVVTRTDREGWQTMLAWLKQS
jgi:tetratricopeptide (TPR) repeat protein